MDQKKASLGRQSTEATARSSSRRLHVAVWYIPGFWGSLMSLLLGSEIWLLAANEMNESNHVRKATVSCIEVVIWRLSCAVLAETLRPDGGLLLEFHAAKQSRLADCHTDCHVECCWHCCKPSDIPFSTSTTCHSRGRDGIIRVGGSVLILLPSA